MQGKYESKILKLKLKVKTYRLLKDKWIQKEKEVRQSRAKWREEALHLRKVNRCLEKKILRLEKSKPSFLNVKAKHHSYPIFLVFLSLCIRQVTGVGWQKCSDLLSLLITIFELDSKCPCANTLLNWSNKYGLFELSQELDTTTEQVLLLDESISVGQKKVFLSQAIDLTNYDFGKSLTHRDTQVVSLGIAKSWKAQDIAKLLPCKNQVSYAVCDGGSNLVKALKDKEITRVYDVTHSLGGLVRKHYSKNPVFLAFSKKTTSFKQKVVLGKDAILMPPTQRPKARFLNIHNLVVWARKIINLFDNNYLTKEQEQKLEWILSFRSLIIELNQVDLLTNAIFAILKPKGLSKKTIIECEQILKQSTAPVFYKDKIKAYLYSYNELIEQYHTIICCSDIIESTFGKFKNRVSSNKMGNITGACLEICTYGTNFKQDAIKIALEKIKISDICQWKNHNEADNLAKRRYELFKKVA